MANNTTAFAALSYFSLTFVAKPILFFQTMRTLQTLAFIAFVALLPCAIHASTQGIASQDAGDLLWEEFLDLMDESDSEGNAFDEDLINDLYYIHTHPYDINKVSADDLSRLPFITTAQADDIVEYAKKHGPVASLGELMMIESLTENDRKMLKLFLCVTNSDTGLADIPSMLKERGKHEAIWRSDIPLYKKEGFKDISKEALRKNPNKVYQGDRFHHSLRYSFNSKNHVMAGMQMEKDAGESGIDHIAGYVMVKDMGFIKNAIVGCFRVNYGKGLAVNTATKFGQSMMTNSIDRMDAGVNKYSGMSEWGYFRGAAITIRRRSCEVSAYASYRDADGTFRNDSTGITAFKTDGMHRTHLERSKKGNIHITDAGANFHWGTGNIMLSSTVALTHLDVPLLPSYNTKASRYKKYQARGKDFAVGSISYLWKNHNLTLSGETAYSTTEHHNGVASLLCMQWNANDNNTFSLIGRYYEAKFVSINGKAFGDNSNVQNEEGVFASWSSRMIRNMQIDLYADYVHFPWMKYGVSSSSNAFEGCVQACFSPNKRTSFIFRYKTKAWQKDFKSNSNTMLGWRISHSAKLSMCSNFLPSWTLKTNASATLVTSSAAASSEKGFSIGNNIRWRHSPKSFWVDLGHLCFFTDSYNARVYGYESSLPYSFGFSSFFYKGMRTTITAYIPIISNRITLNAKIGSTLYFDRKTIGTGLDKINSTHKEDIQLQMKWTL